MSTPNPKPPKKTLAQEASGIETKVESWFITYRCYLIGVGGLLLGFALGHYLA